jgi:asparagine synthase (glutamine-hydrolysing)
MPGIFGILAKHPAVADERLHARARRMAIALRTTPWLRTEHRDVPGFSAGRVHLGLANPAPQPAETLDGGLGAWFDGQLYRGNGAGGVTPTADEVAALVADSGAGLARADGVFALAAFHQASGELTLATDRLGFRPLYWTETPDWFAYASEAKALLAILDSLPPVDEVSLRQFFAFDYMLGERTWWRGVELVPPGACWRVSARGRVVRRYWSFKDIQPDVLGVREAASELAGRWRRAVQERTRPGATPLLLSGGLDSRLVFAELVEHGHDVAPVTFGEAGSPDVMIAARCARLARCTHRAVHVTERNWWDGRDAAIWQTDGLVNAQHLPVALALEWMRAGNQWTLKHSMGDVMFGGSGHWLFPTTVRQPAGGKDWPLVREEFLANRSTPNPFFTAAEVADASRPDCDRYLGGPSVDCLLIALGQRRWQLTGALAMLGHCEVMNPGASLGILELMLGGLGDRQRSGNRFYAPFLCAIHPRYFRTVPWQKTGKGLDEPRSLRAWRRVRKALGFGAAGSTRDFIDYEGLVAADRLAERLAAADLVADEVMRGAFRTALRRRDEVPLPAATLLAVLTLETYLRQAAGMAPLSTGRPALEATHP